MERKREHRGNTVEIKVGGSEGEVGSENYYITEAVVRNGGDTRHQT